MKFFAEKEELFITLLILVGFVIIFVFDISLARPYELN